MGSADEPLPLNSPIDDALVAWKTLFDRVEQAGYESDWKYCWRVPSAMRTVQTDPRAKALAGDALGLYNRLFNAKKTEFRKQGKDHRGKVVLNDRDAGVAASLCACSQVDPFIQATGLAADVYIELTKLVYDRALVPKEQWIDQFGEIKRFADGILGGPGTIDGFISACQKAGLTKRRLPIRWADSRRRWDYGQLREAVVVDEDGHVRIVGTTDDMVNWLGTVYDAPAGQYQLDKGHVLVPDGDAGSDPGPGTSLVVVNGWQGKISAASGKAKETLEIERSKWVHLIGSPADVVMTTWKNKEGIEEPAARVFVNGVAVGWVKADQAAKLTKNVSGVLAGNSMYTLNFLSKEAACVQTPSI
jgi:hypothetical protein